LTLSESVRYIGFNAFTWCRNLTSVTIPQSVEFIGFNAFGDCDSLKNVDVNWEIPLPLDAGEIVFARLDLSRATLRVPFGTAEAYRAAPVWGNFGTITEKEKPIVLPDSIFLNNDSITLKTGETALLVESILPADADNQAVTWLSDDPQIATVVDGLVTALSPGSTTITVTTVEGGLTATCHVTVEDEGVDVGILSPVKTFYVYAGEGLLTINTPAAEHIAVYSISGALLYRVQKSAGEAAYRIDHLPHGVLIVKGSSGWATKILK
jgi:hypothetical protein